MNTILPPIYSLNYSNSYNLRSASVDFLSTVFSKVFKDMYESAQTSSLIPKTPAEKWFNQMLIEEYTRAICKYNLKPLVNQIEKALLTTSRETTAVERK
ncbi:MAG: rRNA (adenine-N6)-dimethyltransferase [Thermotogota bacterium]|nr:rRNA (adenine-N6)-dimethyltransferase [Thermotogota bacterium]MDK2864542.1 rRNA (adenine-N6)-dimethyltransferase [Thermotogota bacterium]